MFRDKTGAAGSNPFCAGLSEVPLLSAQRMSAEDEAG
jgi:hypothetical protein